MLVLSRKPGESIRIGETTVCIIDAKASRVKLGIRAPEKTRVKRSELFSPPCGHLSNFDKSASCRRGPSEDDPTSGNPKVNRKRAHRSRRGSIDPLF